MSKTIKRNWLMKQVELGKIEAKCELHLTDDYRYDNANDFGKTGWMLAYIRKPVFEKLTLDNGCVIDHCVDPDYRNGAMALMRHEFEGKPGYAELNDNGTYTLRVHSNLYYTLRIIK